MIEKNQEQLIKILRCQLFGGEKVNIDDGEVVKILDEADAQAVFTCVFPYLRSALARVSPEKFMSMQERFLSCVMMNTANLLEHGELHKLMSENNIPYSVLKGLASAYYYPEASLRDMGDVDFLVGEKDFSNAEQALFGAGFRLDHGGDPDDIHVAFKREPASIWEQHRSVNGVPAGEAGEKIRAELLKIIPTARQVRLDGVECLIPDDFHHGLIMLLHLAAHLTSEGIGLRHLCDWAVFADSLSNEEFTALFERNLKTFGLWRFAAIMTQVSEKYLGISPKPWAHSVRIGDEALTDVMSDILSGGNFGKKDLNRYREIKYISNRGERTVDGKSVFSQAFLTLNAKVYDDYSFIRNHKFLLPLGWVAEGAKYLALLLGGKRKSENTAAMLKEAASRKSIYSNMKLFEAE